MKIKKMVWKRFTVRKTSSTWKIPSEETSTKNSQTVETNTKLTGRKSRKINKNEKKNKAECFSMSDLFEISSSVRKINRVNKQG